VVKAASRPNKMMARLIELLNGFFGVYTFIKDKSDGFLIADDALYLLNKAIVQVFKDLRIMTSAFEVCPKCASRSDRIYDHRNVKIKDEPLRSRSVFC
jgi:hypothetical protein